MAVTSKVRKQFLQRASCNAKPHLHFELEFLVFIPAGCKYSPHPIPAGCKYSPHPIPAGSKSPTRQSLPA
jgi:hypothetical protein